MGWDTLLKIKSYSTPFLSALLHLFICFTFRPSLFICYIFSVNNVVKDLNYIHELISDMPNAEKLTSLSKSFYENAKLNGYGDLLVSELVKK